MSSLVRYIGTDEVGPIGLGCMNLSHAYGMPPESARAARLLRYALDLGVRHFDTAALYGFGRNETLIGETLGSDRHRCFLASKCGITGVNGRRVIDGRPEVLKQTCREALASNDIRRDMSRFQQPNFSANIRVAIAFQTLAREAGCTPAQLALAWLLHRASHAIPIFGTTSPAHLAENLSSRRVVLDEELMARLEALVTPTAIHGARYSAAAQRDIDTDEAPPA